MSKGRLLLIDDDPEFGDFVRRVAETCGFEVHVMQEPKSFIANYEQLAPDLIALDLAMPETDGIELLRFLAAQGCHVPVLIVSGFDERLIETARRLGTERGLRMAGVVAKPVRVSELSAVLRSFDRAA